MARPVLYCAELDTAFEAPLTLPGACMTCPRKYCADAMKERCEDKQLSLFSKEELLKCYGGRK